MTNSINNASSSVSVNVVLVSGIETPVKGIEFGGVVFINLNKHEIVVGDVAFPPSGLVCTVACKQVQTKQVGGIPVMGNEYGNVENLPNPQEGVVFIVNAMVLGRLVGRPDCVGPDTGPSAIREGGQVKKVVRFVSLPSRGGKGKNLLPPFLLARYLQNKKKTY